MKKTCYIGSMARESECSGRKRLVQMDCSGKKEWICKICFESLSKTPYCFGGLALCDTDCGNHCRD